LTHLLTSRDLITLFRGGAGTGKSFVLKTLVESLRDAGHSVAMLAPQRQQVVDLKEQGFPSPTTLADFLTRKAMNPGAVAVLDEAQVGGSKCPNLSARTVASRKADSFRGYEAWTNRASDAMLYWNLRQFEPAELRKIRRQNQRWARTGRKAHSPLPRVA
jgi:hypothetical protein